jgi:hypothetical protein
MNKKGQLVALLSLFLVIGLIASFLIVNKSGGDVVRIFYTPANVINQHFEIKEYEFNLNQKAKYCSFKAFDSLDCGLCVDSLVSDFKGKFIECFEPFFDVDVKIIENKLKVFGKHQEKKIFEFSNVRTEVKPEFEYILEDYDTSIFEDLYDNCKNVLDCDDLEEKNCKVPKNKCSSKDKYINMEYNLKDNGFIQPKIVFKIRKPEVL